MYTGAPSRAPRPRRATTPTRAPIPRPATAATCNRDRATALPRSCVSRCVDRRSMNLRNAAEGIQPSANVVQSLGNALIATPRPAHSQKTRKPTGQQQPAENATDGRQTGKRHAVQLSTVQSRPGSTRNATTRRDRWRKSTQPTHRAIAGARATANKRESPHSGVQTSPREAVRGCLFPFSTPFVERTRLHGGESSHCRKEYAK